MECRPEGVGVGAGLVGNEQGMRADDSCERTTARDRHDFRESMTPGGDERVKGTALGLLLGWGRETGRPSAELRSLPRLIMLEARVHSSSTSDDGSSSTVITMSCGQGFPGIGTDERTDTSSVSNHACQTVSHRDPTAPAREGTTLFQRVRAGIA